MLLSKLLKEETKSFHKDAEAHPWVRLLVMKKLPVEYYFRYLQQLHPLYQTLESLLGSADEFGLYRNELSRSDKIRLDLAYFTKHFNCKTMLIKSNYMNHLKSIPFEDSYRLIGHFYVRYFGDMLGGAMIKKMVQANYSASKNAINFYDFQTFNLFFPDGINDLRLALDNIVLTKNQQDDVIYETKKAYELTYEIMTLSMYATDPS